MIVRVYNKETYEADYYHEIKEVHEGYIDFVLEYVDGKTRLFDNDIFEYCIVRR